MQASAVLLCKCDEILLDSSTATEDLNFLGGANGSLHVFSSSYIAQAA